MKPNGSLFSGASGQNPAIDSEDSRKLAVFLVEEFDLSDDLQINGGVRLESFDRKFDKVQSRIAKTGLLTPVGVSPRISGNGWSFSGNLSYSERVPETSELYSNGPHHGSETFDVGDPSLDTETAIGLEFILRRTLGNVTGQISAFRTQFDGYVYPNAVPFWDSALNQVVKHMKYTAADADFRGLEAELDWMMTENDGQALIFPFTVTYSVGRNETITLICHAFHLQELELVLK